MDRDEKRKEAEKLYVEKCLSCATIAEQLGVVESTVYRWKAAAAEAAEKDMGWDWESLRRVYNLAADEMFAMYAETVKSWIVEIHKNRSLLSDPKVADAMVKHMSVLKKLDTRGQYKRGALDMIKTANQWLAENRPELKAKLDSCWDSIVETLIKSIGEKETG
jgi:uncharacterized protein YjcR